MPQELTWTASVDPARAAASMRLLANEAKAATASIEASVRKEAQAAIALQRQRSSALISEWKRETRESEKEQQAQKRAAESLQRQRSAAIVASWRAQERERVNIARQAQAQIEANERASQQRRSAFVSGAIGGVTALIGVSAVNEIRQAGAAWLDYASKLESTRIAFTTMLGSAQLAEAHLKELQQFALKTPFQFGELIDASQRMQALGFNAQQVIPILTDVGNAVAAAGGGSERLDRVVLALSQIQSKGKVMTQELNQLAESGIPAWRIMEEQLGKTRAELIKMVEQGQISSQVFLDAFQKFSQQNFGGLMEAQSKTFTGAMSNIKDALLQTSATAFAPLYERLSENARALAELSTKSKEFQQNMETAGRVIIQVWDGIAEAFYIARDAIRIVAAVGIQVIGALTHTFLALASAVTATLFYLEALGKFMAGDFKGAFEAAASGQNALRSATDELTQAARSQFAVAEALGRVWTEAGVRARAAGLAMQTAAAVMGAMPQSGGAMTLSGGLQSRTTSGAGVPRGGGGGGAAKVSEGQRLLNQLTDEHNRLTAKANELSKVQIVALEILDGKYKGLTTSLRGQILEQAAQIDVAQKSIEADKRKEQATEKVRAVLDRQIEALKDARQGDDEWEDEIVKLEAALKKLGLTMDENTKKMLRENAETLKAISLTRERIALEQTRIDRAERDRFATPERKQEQLDIEQEGPLGDIGRQVLEGAAAGAEAASAWDLALGSIMGRMQDFQIASQMYVVGAFHSMAEAAQDAIAAWILYGGSLGKALKQALAAELAHVAASAAIQAALHAAYAIGNLAFGNFGAAAKHGIAAAKFAAVAALAGIAARGLAGSAAGAQGGGATAGSAFQSANQPRSQAGQPTTIDVNRRTSAQPMVNVNIQLYGDLATDALKTRVIDAVVEGLDLNDTRLTTQIQGAAQRAR
jgi:tape measure domain-containing protein